MKRELVTAPSRVPVGGKNGIKRGGGLKKFLLSRKKIGASLEILNC